jgi:hypothetical protein
VDEAVHVLTAATSACPEMLARLAEDNLLDREAQQGAWVAGCVEARDVVTRGT